MKFNIHLGHVLGGIYLIFAGLILLYWATTPIPNPNAIIFSQMRDLTQVLILNSPYLVDIFLTLTTYFFHINLDHILFFAKSLTILIQFTSVILNAISWFYIGKWYQWKYVLLYALLFKKKERKKIIRQQIVLLILSILFDIALLSCILYLISLN